MGFGDEDFDKAKGIGTSDTQLYKQARKLNLCACFRTYFFTTIQIKLTNITIQ